MWGSGAETSHVFQNVESQKWALSKSWWQGAKACRTARHRLASLPRLSCVPTGRGLKATISCPHQRSGSSCFEHHSKSRTMSSVICLTCWAGSLGHQRSIKRFWFIPHVSFGALNPYIAASWSWGEGRAPLRGVGKGHPPAWNQHPSYRTIPAHPHGPISCVGSVALVSNWYPYSLKTLCTRGICLLFLDILQDPHPFLLYSVLISTAPTSWRPNFLPEMLHTFVTPTCFLF